MKHIFRGLNIIGAIALLAVVLGCAANTQSTENLLSAAGFRTIVANTPQRQQHLKTLPANKGGTRATEWEKLLCLRRSG